MSEATKTQTPRYRFKLLHGVHIDKKPGSDPKDDAEVAYRAGVPGQDLIDTNLDLRQWNGQAGMSPKFELVEDRHYKPKSGEGPAPAVGGDDIQRGPRQPQTPPAGAEETTGQDAVLDAMTAKELVKECVAEGIDVKGIENSKPKLIEALKKARLAAV